SSCSTDAVGGGARRLRSRRRRPGPKTPRDVFHGWARQLHERPPMLLSPRIEHSSSRESLGAVHRRLAAFNHTRLTPRITDTGTDEDDAEHDRLTQLERDFVEAERRRVAQRAKEAPRDADGFVAWFEALEHHGPGPGDPLHPCPAPHAPWHAECVSLPQRVAA